jgi:hypothetical protein
VVVHSVVVDAKPRLSPFAPRKGSSEVRQSASGGFSLTVSGWKAQPTLFPFADRKATQDFAVALKLARGRRVADERN